MERSIGRLDILEDRGGTPLVSGANRGIGREIVRQLAGRGMVAILGSRDDLAPPRRGWTATCASGNST